MRHGFFAVGVVLSACIAGAQQPEPGPEWFALQGHDVGRIENAEVTYLASRAVTLSQRPATDRLLQAAAARMSAGDVNASFRFLTRWFAVHAGLKYGEWLDVACALDFSIDVRLAAPGDVIHARLEPLYQLDEPLKAAYAARITLLNASGQKVAEAKPILIEIIAAEETRLATANLPMGDYTVRYELLDAAGKTVVSASRPVRLDAALKSRATALEARVVKLAGQAAPRDPRQGLALEALAALADLYGRATRSYVGNLPERLHPATLSFADPPPPYWSMALNPDEDFALADKLSDALAAGGDPFAGLSGELHLAVRSGEGFRPYRLFIPPGYDAAAQYPLVLALHGEVGDEELLFNPPGGQGALVRAAAAHHTFVVAPRVAVVAGAEDAAQKRLLQDLVAHVSAAFPVDGKRLFAVGHSLGAFTVLGLVWSPDQRWAGYASMAGPLIRPNSPPPGSKTGALYVIGGADRQTPLVRARRMAIQMERAFPCFEYLEAPQADHYALLAAAWPRVFSFFGEISAGTWKKPKDPIPLPDDVR